jgi:Ca-activated chloride channel homolog
MSKHRRAARTARRQRRSVLAWTAAGAVGVLGLTAGTVAMTFGTSAGTRCPAGERRLVVAVAPELLGVVSDAARAVAPSTGAGGRCVRVQVDAEAPAAVAAALRTSGADVPDVWIPDSSLWGQLAGQRRVLSAGPSIARSPVVLAVSRATAARYGFPAHRPSFAQLMGSPQAQPARLVLPDPARSATAVGVLLGLQSAAAGEQDGRVAMTTALRAAQRDAQASPETLLDGLATGPVSAIAVSEQAVRTHNQSTPAAPAVAVYPQAGATLDYPYLVLTDDKAAATGAAALLRRLEQPTSRAALQLQGFRDARGAAGPVPAGDSSVDPDAAAAATVTAAQAQAAARVLRVVNLPTRMLAVMDISGSMGEPVPGAHGQTRLQLALDAAGNGLNLFSDQSSIGLWTFSTNLTASTDYRQLVPLGPLGVRSDGVTGREKLATALAATTAIRGGSTGLYDTALAAVREVRTGWDPARVNSVVLLTDGRNEDSHGLTLPQLLSALRAQQDPRRPVPVISIAYGPDSDVAALQAISKATAGATYVSRDPRDIRHVIQDALSQRVCRPDC